MSAGGTAYPVEVRYRDGAMELVRVDKPASIAIRNVIFNPPATVVFFEDGTKTVVVDTDSPRCDIEFVRSHIGYKRHPTVRRWCEAGVNLAVLKRLTGNKHIKEVKRWIG